MEGYYYGSETNHEFGSSYSSMEGLGLEIMRTFMDGKRKKERRRSKVAQEAAIVRMWGGTNGYLTLHMNL